MPWAAGHKGQLGPEEGAVARQGSKDSLPRTLGEESRGKHESCLGFLGTTASSPHNRQENWVSEEVVSVSASKHYVGISSFGSQYSSLLQSRRKSFL